MATLLLTALLAASPNSGAQELPVNPPWLVALWPPAAEVRFQPTSLEERQLFAKLIPEVLTACAKHSTPPKSLTALAAKASFILESSTAQGEHFWTLREAAARYRGAGAYVFRTGPASDVIIQAPHADYDLGTGQLGAQLFLSGLEGKRPRAFFTNTAHRYKSRSGERREDAEHPADVAHNAEHLFQITTDLTVRAMTNPRVVQLHGFGPSEVKDREDLVAVVSAGSELPSAWSESVTERLRENFGDGVRLYPRDTKILGGTQNVQGRLLKTYPNARFLHLELSSSARKELTQPERMGQLCRALFEPTTP